MYTRGEGERGGVISSLSLLEDVYSGDEGESSKAPWWDVGWQL